MKKKFILLAGLSILSLTAAQNYNNNENDEEQMLEMPQQEEEMNEQQEQEQQEQVEEQEKQAKAEKIEAMSPEERKEIMVKPFRVTANNETGKDIKVEFEYEESEYPGDRFDPGLHRGERDIILYGESQPEQGKTGSSTIEHCVKKITVKEINGLTENIVAEKEVDACDDLTIDINRSEEGEYTINTGFLGRLFGGW